MENPVWFLRSWLGWLNFFVMQWFTLRLVQCWTDGLAGQSVYLGSYLDSGIVPLTGWWNNYWRLWPKRPVPERIYTIERRILRNLDTPKDPR